MLNDEDMKVPVRTPANGSATVQKHVCLMIMR